MLRQINTIQTFFTLTKDGLFQVKDNLVLFPEKYKETNKSEKFRYDLAKIYLNFNGDLKDQALELEYNIKKEDKNSFD